MHRHLFAAAALIAGCSSLQAQAPTLNEVAADRRLWPAQVRARVPVKVATLVAGAPTGSVEVPPGRPFRLVRVEPTRLTLDFAGSTAVVAPGDTDLLEQASARKLQLAAAAAAATPVPAPTPAPSISAPPRPLSIPQAVIPKALAGDLVAVEGKSLKPFADQGFGGVKYSAFYFSAHWCGPCRAFTPKLVEFYKGFKPDHPEFELIFVSSDHSAEEMEQYMQEAGMSWPALAYRKVRSAGAITRYAGRGIPCLVLVDADGKVLSDSYEGKNYLGPGKVLQDILATLPKRG